MTIQVFGHKSPDTDTVGSAIVWAWYHNEYRGEKAEARILGELNTETAFVLDHWDVPKPERLDDVEPGQTVAIVDTNNVDELPASINQAEIRSIVDHHLLQGGLKTKAPIPITVRPVACTATILGDLMGDAVDGAPDWIKGLMLSCIISDTLAFRSPTTADPDRELGRALARDLGVTVDDYAQKMFAAKSDVSGFGDEELLRMDSKQYDIDGRKLRISVLETTTPGQILDRKESLMRTMPEVARQDGVENVLFFAIDILEEQATLLIQNDDVRKIAEASFDVSVGGDTVVLPGVVSRKKQILPNLKV